MSYKWRENQTSQINGRGVFNSTLPGSLKQQLSLTSVQNPIVDEKKLLKVIDFERSEYQKFASLATKRTISGYQKIIRLTRTTTMYADTQPLVEGIPPTPRIISAHAIVATLRSYAALIRFTDESLMTSRIDMVMRAKQELIKLFVKTEDLLAQNALLADGHEWFPAATGATNKEDLVDFACAEKTTSEKNKSDSRLDTSTGYNSIVDGEYTDSSIYFEELWIIKAKMKAAKVEMFGNSYKFLCHPHVAWDLWQSAVTEKYMKIAQDASPLKTGSAPTIFGVSIIEVQTIFTETVKTSNKNEATVYASFMLGKECLERINRSDSKFEVISKPLGSSGEADPVNQRASYAWKYHNLGYWVMNPDAVTIIYSVPSLAYTKKDDKVATGVITQKENIERTGETNLRFNYLNGGEGRSSVSTYVQFTTDEKYKEPGFRSLIKSFALGKKTVTSGVTSYSIENAFATATNKDKFLNIDLNRGFVFNKTDFTETEHRATSHLSIPAAVLSVIFNGNKNDYLLKTGTVTPVGSVGDYINYDKLKTENAISPKTTITALAKVIAATDDAKAKALSPELKRDTAIIVMRYIEETLPRFFKNTYGQNNYNEYKNAGEQLFGVLQVKGNADPIIVSLRETSKNGKKTLINREEAV